jgi:hypothetical protein
MLTEMRRQSFFAADQPLPAGLLEQRQICRQGGA